MGSVSFTHPKWGAIKVTYTARAKRITMRGRPDAIHMTVPAIASNRDIEKALEQFGEKLLQQREKNPCRTIDTDFSIASDNIRFKVEERGEKGFTMRYHEGGYILSCPHGTDYHAIQEWLHKVVANTIAKEAKRVLPARLKELAARNGFKYSKCSVRNMRTRWGSCNQRGDISLCASLMLLPDRLVDYVLLHELCHTVEMNHSERFWKLLDNVCGCSSRDLRKELKKHSTTI